MILELLPAPAGQAWCPGPDHGSKLAGCLLCTGARGECRCDCHQFGWDIRDFIHANLEIAALSAGSWHDTMSSCPAANLPGFAAATGNFTSTAVFDPSRQRCACGVGAQVRDMLATFTALTSVHYPDQQVCPVCGPFGDRAACDVVRRIAATWSYQPAYQASWGG